MPILYVEVQYKIWILSGIRRCANSYFLALLALRYTQLLACRLIDDFQIESYAHNFLFGTTTTPYNTFFNSHFFSGQSQHTSSPSIVLYLWLGARRPMAQSYDSSRSPGTTQGDHCIFLGETLPLKTFHAKLNSRSAVSTRCPTTSHHLLEKQVTSSQKLRSTCYFLHTHLQEPDFFLVHK